MASNTITSLREICNNCRTEKTNKNLGQYQFEARFLDREETMEARYGMFASAQTLDLNLFTVIPDALDGKEFKWWEFESGQVHSRATGGLAKDECGFDEQSWKRKNIVKTQETEKLYIHRAECMLNYIGSVAQSNPNGTGPVYFTSGSGLQAVARTQGLMVDLMVRDIHDLAKAIDGCNVLGNWTGTGTGTVLNGAASKYPHYDGIIKQTLQQAGAAYHHTVDVVIPTVAAPGGLFVTWNGDRTEAFADVTSLVNGINALKLDTTGDLLFSAIETTTAGTIRITANNIRNYAYGDDSLLIFASTDGTYSSCESSLEATEVQCKMAYAEQPTLFDWNEKITSDNFYDYFVEKIKVIIKNAVSLQENSADPMTGNGRHYIACDPLMLIDKDFDQLRRMCNCNNAIIQTTAYDNLFPDFVGVDCLKGTGIWYSTYSTNAYFLTNVESDLLSNIEMWYNQDCQKVKMRNEVLGNAMVVDFAKVATNACNSPFEASLKAPYQPKNLPHLCPDIARKNCCTDTCNYDGTDFLPKGTVKVTCPDAAVDPYVFTLTDFSLIPDDDSIATVSWALYAVGGAPATVTGEAVTTNVPAADYAGVNLVIMTVTLTSGEMKEFNISKAQFELENC